MTRRAERLALAGVLVVALLIRIAYAVRVGEGPLSGDAIEFGQLARGMADGHGYVNASLSALRGIEVPTADKPPLYPATLALLDLVGLSSTAGHQASGLASGTALVLVVALLAREVSGRRGVGVAAAAIAAVYPPLIMADGSLRSESLFALLVASALLAAVRFRRRPALSTSLVGGACVALAALTRGEALLLVGLLPLAIAVGRPVGVRPRHGAVAAAAVAVVLVPWLVRCYAAFDQVVLISTNTGGLVAGANCDDSYYGPNTGGWTFSCLGNGFGLSTNEATAANALRDQGVDYARAHAGRLPAVLVARVGRTFDVRHPRALAGEQRFFEGRDLRVAQAGVAAFYLVVLAALIGLLSRRLARTDVLVLLSPVVVVVFVTVTAYGWIRLRVGAEPALVVLAATGLSVLLDRVRARAQ